MELEKRRIGVLMGGWSREREISLLSGNLVYEALKRKDFDAVPIDIKKESLDSLRRHWSWR